MDPLTDITKYSVELEHAIGYSSVPEGLCFHNRSKHFVYPTGSSIVIRAFDDPHEQYFLRGHSSDINCLCVSSLGTFIASGDIGTNSDVVVWDYEEKLEIWRFSEHDGGISSMCFSHDERLLLTIGFDNRLAIWDLKTGMIVCSTDLPKILGQITCASWGGFAKDVKRRNTQEYQFATGGDVLCMWVINPFNGHLNFEVAESRRNVRKSTCLTFLTAPDSAGRDGYFDEYLIAGTLSGDFVSYLVKASRQIGGAPKASFISSTPSCGGGVLSIASMSGSPGNEPIVAVGGGDGTIFVFKYIITGSDASYAWVDEEGVSVNGAVCAVDISEDRIEILAGTQKGDVLKAKRGLMNSSENLKLVCRNHCSGIVAVDYAPGSNVLFATACEDGTIRVWSADDYSVKTEIKIRQNKPQPAAPICLVFTVDAIITGWSDSCVRCHHAVTGELLWTVENAHSGGVTAIAISHNLKFFLTGGQDGGVRMWEMRTRDLVAILKEHSRRVTKIVIFKDDVHAMTCSRDRSFLCWDLRHEKRISSHIQRMGGIHSLALNHDESFVLTVGQERNITVWDIRNPFPVAVVERPQDGMHLDEATVISTSHSGKMFATGGMDNQIKLWILDGKTPKLAQTNVAHSSSVMGLAFSEDDRQLISVGPDGAIFIWNIFQPLV